jgi:hypothetical protein
VAVLALALHEAIEGACGDSAGYRWGAMEMFEAGRVDADDLRRLADTATGGALDDEQLHRGLGAVAESHRHAAALGVFGTPTLVDGDARAYLKLAEQPAPQRARAVFSSVTAVLHDTPEVAEIKRPG